MKPVGSTFVLRLVLWIARRVFSLRYRVEFRGLDRIRAAGRTGIVFLPNHPALIDPVMMVLYLYPDFTPRSLADEWQVDRPIVGRLARMFGARILPNLERGGLSSLERTRRTLAETVDGLKAGENLLLYPAGHLKHCSLEEIGAASGVKLVLDQVPRVRVVLVRQNGLWGSSFSFGATGRMPQMLPCLLHGLKYLLLNGVFFMPRRRVKVELVEPADLPRSADRLVLNRYLETFYNAATAKNTHVPYGFWERGGARDLPDPPVERGAGDVTAAPPATRQLVVSRLAAMTGRTGIQVTDRLAQDLGMDSLAVAELIVWIEQEFGFSVGTPDSLRTVGEVMLAASGKGISAADADLAPVGRHWFAPATGARLRVPPGATVAEAFLRQAAFGPGRPVLADQTSGVRTYRDLITGLLLLKPLVEEMPGRYVGIMLPASVGAGLFYLACLFAGKTPVMVNWTTGSRNLVHSLDLLGVQRVITAGPLLTRLRSLGIDVSALGDRFVLAEDLRSRMTAGAKLMALIRSFVSWRRLKTAQPPAEAVVLFTSGSESLPKAVPLTDRNILTNIRDTLDTVSISDRDVIIGMLPPFHSFGITVTTVLPLCCGLRTIYHPNPTEAAVLARLVEAYKVSLLVGTPTFLNGIVRVAQKGQLDSLRLAVTGAEKCPQAVYEALGQRCPQLIVLEGYGITECSPIVSVNTVEAPVPCSVGKLLPSVEGVIIGLETEGRTPPGQTGMLLVRGPSIFPGYLNYEGPSPFVTFEGKAWYRTGDLVCQTGDGVLSFQGRLKRFVKIGGEMISLPAIEAALWPHFVAGDDQGPPIAVEALGDADSPDLVLFTTSDTDRASVNALLREAGLSPLYNVRQVVRVESIPVLGTGKTDYRRLKERYGSVAGRSVLL
jgi:acyl-CoA synthetase (AMP-forming)/AMP-acid ligase II/1-acyl-sn-glycerol-3-phosphate acyltransferase/acyl carrier protein